MKILLTGASCMLGKKIVSNNTHLIIETLGRSIQNTYTYDICTPIGQIINDYEYVIHVAGKAHEISTSESVAKLYFETNYLGTLNLLRSLETSRIKNFIFISTVAVYGLIQGNLVNEKSDLLAKDPYALSKLNAENAIIEWCNKRNVNYTILRLPLLIGNNAPGNLRNMIIGIKKGFYFNVGGGVARKSMVLVDDVADFIFKAGQCGGIYNLTDGIHPSFKELSTLFSIQLNKNPPLNIPLWFAKLLSKVGDIVGDKMPINSNKLTKIISNLTFDDTLARQTFGWNPKSILQNFKLNSE